MSSDVFIISTARDPQAAAALQQALEPASLAPAQVQDLVFGLDSAISQRALDGIARSAGLVCPLSSVSPSLRAMFFAAASILSDDVQLSLVAGLYHDASVAFLLASPEAVGRLNLLPCARVAARSLGGRETALRQAGLGTADVEVSREGERGALLLNEVLEELEAASGRWGLVIEGQSAVLIERL